MLLVTCHLIHVILNLMIYTVTLSPALDYLIWLDRFEAGTLNRTGHTAFRAGGKGINVSVVLSRLGCQSICLGFTAGFVGDELIRLLDAEGIRHDFIPVENGCTRVNVKIKAETESEINPYGPEINEKELAALKAQAGRLESGDMLVFSGNPPKNMPADIYSQLMDAVTVQDVRFVVDTSGKNLTTALSRHPWLIKPNKAELEEVFGTEMDSIAAIASHALKLREMGAENVLVSLGADGALLAADDGRVYTCAVPKGVLRDSTGAGDSMAAGFIAKDLSGEPRDECLRFAVACGCASAYSDQLLMPGEPEAVYAVTPEPVVIG